MSEFSQPTRDLGTDFLRRPRRDKRGEEKGDERGPAAAGYSTSGSYTRMERVADNPEEDRTEKETEPSRASHFAEFTIMLGTGRIQGNYSRYFRSRAFLLAAVSVSAAVRP